MYLKKSKKTKKVTVSRGIFTDFYHFVDQPCDFSPCSDVLWLMHLHFTI